MAKQLRDQAGALTAMNSLPPSDSSRALMDENAPCPSGLFESQPNLESSQFPRSLIGFATDHLRAILALWSTSGLAATSVSLMRPTVEALASAHYLLGEDIDQAERIRRWANYQLSSLIEQERMFFEQPDSPELIRIREAISRAESDGQAFSLEMTGVRKSATPWPRDRWFGEKPPRTMDLVTALLESHDTAAGASFYRMLSAMQHSQGHGMHWLTQRVEDEASPFGDGNGKAMALSPQNAAFYTRLLMHCFVPTIGRAARYYGWPEALWNEELSITFRVLQVVSAGPQESP